MNQGISEIAATDEHKSRGLAVKFQHDADGNRRLLIYAPILVVEDGPGGKKGFYDLSRNQEAAKKRVSDYAMAMANKLGGTVGEWKNPGITGEHLVVTLPTACNKLQFLAAHAEALKELSALPEECFFEASPERIAGLLNFGRAGRPGCESRHGRG